MELMQIYETVIITTEKIRRNNIIMKIKKKFQLKIDIHFQFLYLFNKKIPIFDFYSFQFPFLFFTYWTMTMDWSDNIRNHWNGATHRDSYSWRMCLVQCRAQCDRRTHYSPALWPILRRPGNGCHRRRHQHSMPYSNPSIQQATQTKIYRCRQCPMAFQVFHYRMAFLVQQCSDNFALNVWPVLTIDWTELHKRHRQTVLRRYECVDGWLNWMCLKMICHNRCIDVVSLSGAPFESAHWGRPPCKMSSRKDRNDTFVCPYGCYDDLWAQRTIWNAASILRKRNSAVRNGCVCVLSNYLNSRRVYCMFRIDMVSRWYGYACAMLNCLPERISCRKFDRRVAVRPDVFACASSSSRSRGILFHTRNTVRVLWFCFWTIRLFVSRFHLTDNWMNSILPLIVRKICSIVAWNGTKSPTDESILDTSPLA